MTQLQETLNILLHYDNVISGRTNYCRRHADFISSNCVEKKLKEKIKNGFVNKPIANDPVFNEISRECADIRIALHSYLCLNIIDIFSFDDEYNKFFVENKFDDSTLKTRINNVKTKNKEIRKKLDWKQLKRFRNQVLAHNLRDEKNRFSIKTLKEITNLLSNFEVAIAYSEIVLRLFDNIRAEFETEINEAQKALKSVIREKKS